MAVVDCTPETGARVRETFLARGDQNADRWCRADGQQCRCELQAPRIDYEGSRETDCKRNPGGSAVGEVQRGQQDEQQGRAGQRHVQHPQRQGGRPVTAQTTN